MTRNTEELLFELVAPVIGSFLVIGLFLGPFPAVCEARRLNALGDINALVFPWIAANCAAFSTLGFLRKDWFLIVPNSIGFLAGLFYLFSSLGLASKEGNENVVGALERVTLTLFAMFFVILILARSFEDDANNIVGNFGMIISIIMFASPLSTIQHVLLEKNSSTINIGFLIGQICSCAMWALYGAAKKDPYVGIPSGLGFWFGLCQLALVVFLPRKRKELVVIASTVAEPYIDLNQPIKPEISIDCDENSIVQT